MPDKLERREARVRGAGTRVKVEDLHIASPEHRELAALESVFIKEEDKNLPRLRSLSTQNNKSAARRHLQEARQDRRKLTFSSDDDDDTHTIAEQTQQNDHLQTEYAHGSVSPLLPADLAESRPVSPTPETDTVPTVQPKRRRGRPRKHEQEKKVQVVTRRSRRLVENPALRQHTHEPILAAPKPLRATGLVPHTIVPAATPLSQPNGKTGKQRPLTIDAERLHTGARDRRFRLTTLDVLLQFIEDHLPRASKNDIVPEQIILDEFKAHLAHHVRRLMDLHASTRDICHDIAEVQRRKNETRQKILALKRRHADVGADLAKVRLDYAEDKRRHAEMEAMAAAFSELQKAVAERPPPTLSHKVNLELDSVARVFDRRTGVALQLQAINAELAARVANQ